VDDVLPLLAVDDDVTLLVETVDIMPDVLIEGTLNTMFCVVVVCPSL